MRLIFLLIIVSAVSGCASQRIVIDKKGVDMAQYERDLAECREYAKEVPAGSEVASGAVGGAVIGGIIGGIVGDSRTAEKAGGVGAVTGAARGGERVREERELIVKNCLRNRGYKVLN